MTKPIFAGNDLNVGVTITDKLTGAVVSGLTLRAWISADETHSTASPAVPIDSDLDVTGITESPGSSGIYPGGIDKAKITARLIDADPDFIDQDVFLHREDPTRYYSVERCRVYAQRFILT